MEDNNQSPSTNEQISCCQERVEEVKEKRKQQPNPLSKKSMKKRKKILKEQNEGICLNFMKTGKCERENCKYSHDLKEYLSKRTDLLEGICPLFKEYGFCPNGYTCEWYKSHINEQGELITNNELMKLHPFKEPLNTQKPETLHVLRTNKFDFKIPEEFPVPEKKILDLKGKLILPSLCTFGNLPFRKVVKRFGCDVTMTEMIMAESLVEGKTSEWALVKRDSSEDIFGIQLCVGNSMLAAKACQVLNSVDCDFYELNCACPIDYVYKKGMGAQLIERPKRIESLLHAMRSVTERPVAIKVRTGKSSNTIQDVLLPNCADYGAAMVSIHGRTRDQRYTKSADWDFIKQATTITQCPVIGVGDIYGYKDYQKALDCGVATVAIGRGALIKPWIYTEIKEKRDWDISSSERLDILRQYALDGLSHWGSDAQGISKTREFMCHHLTFMTRYVPVHCVIETNQEISIKVRNDRVMCYRDDMEKLLTSDRLEDYIKITEMFLGPAPKDFVYVPKHQSYVKM
ncbi:dihydrouridine synthase (dus), putative [Entamoeba histolytica HM-1:IMSS-B]|uniref:tRNA-dihydrouridine(47) synthase [NAD(P)(+)] n=4 Tax=Entamoeba histolytica TaxID=5759 RepID=C4M482_ENTH1|nr:hypothetical protein, conserved [Entamoeba histolytica HM-1:IMSS]EAL46349.1 hypothetical protein, conserved [Entamoeba histolytica HM-1:IMSS]EMH76130.1 dihydrouridine synthase (dus), putative [Entamoeba histolytica HM-1:IMSS-B]ENY61986.1 tRNA-dihydrouridine synthase, putative [Entamoeba histolytica HM-1:IMSS-A]GAT96162.1 hypothetical protein conserved [Entamoeba histolytica]|eukprot:XP_651736.1 hypothetical protein, conserved [Entamoeba histolytica HM-1:IMSS]